MAIRPETLTLRGMSEDLLERIEVETGPSPTHAVLWLHGLGASGHDFEGLLPYLDLSGTAPTRFVFPHAPSMPVTLNHGMVMPAWYDILSMDLKRRADEDGVRASAARLTDLIRHENERGIPSERIVLAGFSQGGAVAVHAGLRHPETLCGIMALSTYLVCDETLDAERSPANRATPIFQAHGTYDPMVPVDRGVGLRERLVGLGYDVRYHDYPMQHEVCPDEIVDISAWLRERLT